MVLCYHTGGGAAAVEWRGDVAEGIVGPVLRCLVHGLGAYTVCSGLGCPYDCFEADTQLCSVPCEHVWYSILSVCMSGKYSNFQDGMTFK